MKSFLKLIALVLSLLLGITYTALAQQPNQQAPIYRRFSWTYGGYAFHGSPPVTMTKQPKINAIVG